MEKLVFQFSYDSCVDNGDYIQTFEYKSKESFCNSIILLSEVGLKHNEDYCVEIFGVYLNATEVQNIRDYVMTLDEFYNKNFVDVS